MLALEIVDRYVVGNLEFGGMKLKAELIRCDCGNEMWVDVDHSRVCECGAWLFGG